MRRILMIILLIASVNAATPISSCGTISSSGEYYLTNNLTSNNGQCLRFENTKNIYVDLNGYTITCNSGSGSCVDVVTITNFTITNGTIVDKNPNEYTFFLYYSNSVNINNLTINKTDTTKEVIITISSSNNVIEHNKIISGDPSKTDATVFWIDQTSTIRNNSIYVRQTNGNECGGSYCSSFDYNYWGQFDRLGYSDTCADNDNDYICDQPYTVAGDGSKDNHPLTYDPTTPIRYEDPTPLDGSKINTSNVFINATTMGFISSTAYLEWDGVNESMNINGKNIYLNKTASDGWHNFKIFAYDSGNNEWHSTKTRSILVDTVPPTLSASAVDENGSTYQFGTWINSSYVNISLSCSDNTGCDVYYCTNLDSPNCNPTTKYTTTIQINGEGVHYIVYKANDSVNNEANDTKTVKIIGPHTIIQCGNYSGTGVFKLYENITINSDVGESCINLEVYSYAPTIDFMNNHIEKISGNTKYAINVTSESSSSNVILTIKNVGYIADLNFIYVNDLPNNREINAQNNVDLTIIRGIPIISNEPVYETTFRSFKITNASIINQTLAKGKVHFANVVIEPYAKLINASVFISSTNTENGSTSNTILFNSTQPFYISGKIDSLYLETDHQSNVDMKLEIENAYVSTYSERYSHYIIPKTTNGSESETVNIINITGKFYYCVSGAYCNPLLISKSADELPFYIHIPSTLTQTRILFSYDYLKLYSTSGYTKYEVFSSRNNEDKIAYLVPGEKYYVYLNDSSGHKEGYGYVICSGTYCYLSFNTGQNISYVNFTYHTGTCYQYNNTASRCRFAQDSNVSTLWRMEIKDIDDNTIGCVIETNGTEGLMECSYNESGLVILCAKTTNTTECQKNEIVATSIHSVAHSNNEIWYIIYSGLSIAGLYATTTIPFAGAVIQIIISLLFYYTGTITNIAFLTGINIIWLIIMLSSAWLSAKQGV